jgi:hypothetical protein
MVRRSFAFLASCFFPLFSLLRAGGLRFPFLSKELISMDHFLSPGREIRCMGCENFTDG